MLIEGQATAEGTRRYRDRMVERGVHAAHFREAAGLTLSSIGLGTYLGPTDDGTDERYVEAALAAVESGCNVFDTAINYRHQRSERALGEAFARMVEKGIASRDELVVATKGGFIPLDSDMPGNPADYFSERFLSRGLLSPEDVVAGMHCMTPRYLQDQVGNSLRNLGVATVDIYYLHNPEMQREEVGAAEFRRRMRAAFEALEVAVAEERIGAYGTATWDGYRVPADAPDHLELAELVAIAGEVGGSGHSFRFVQLPHNLAMPEVLAVRNQGPGARRSALDATAAAGITVMASRSLAKGRLGSGLPPEIGEALPGLETDAQRALQFVRSTPGIAVALVGMSKPEHVAENLSLARRPPATETQFLRLFRP